jgi:hypothetical protein
MSGHEITYLGFSLDATERLLSDSIDFLISSEYYRVDLDLFTESALFSGNGIITRIGTGSPTTQKMLFDGTGIKTVLCTGSFSTEKTEASGFGIITGFVSAIGDFSTEKMTASGGAQITAEQGVITATGELICEIMAASGGAKLYRVYYATGSPIASKALFSGSAIKTLISTGAIESNATTLAGTGIKTILGTGGIETQSPTITGGGIRSILGMGNPETESCQGSGGGIIYQRIWATGELSTGEMSFLSGAVKTVLCMVADAMMESVSASGGSKKTVYGSLNEINPTMEFDAGGRNPAALTTQTFRIRDIEKVEGKPYKLLYLEPVRRPINK